MSVRVEVSRNGNVLETLKSKVNSVMVPMLIESSAEYAKRQMQSHCPVKTGALRDSIQIDLNGSGDEARIQPALEYGVYMEKGTVPHVILPRRARVLHWVNDAGQDCFASKVQHPGTAPRNFVMKAAVEVSVEVVRLWKVTFESVVVSQ